MSLSALHAGIGNDWGFESFPEYLDAIESRGHLDQRRRVCRSHADPALRNG